MITNILKLTTMKKYLVFGLILLAGMTVSCNGNDALSEMEDNQAVTRVAASDEIMAYNPEVDDYTMMKVTFLDDRSSCIIKAEAKDQFLKDIESLGADLSALEISEIPQVEPEKENPAPFVNCLQILNVSVGYKALEAMDAVIFASPYLKLPTDWPPIPVVAFVYVYPKNGDVEKMRKIIKEYGGSEMCLWTASMLGFTLASFDNLCIVGLTKWSKLTPIELYNTLNENGIYSELIG